MWKGAFAIAVILATGTAVAFSLFPGATAQPASSTAGVCQRCHQDRLPLPERHPPVQGVTIAACAPCHASQATQTRPYPFAARLHRAHPAARLDCSSCHAYTPGERFAAATGDRNLGAFDLAQYERLRQSVATWAHAKGLAATHGSKQDLSCGACHRSQLFPDDNETVVNAQCVACHGNYERLAAVTKAKLKNPEINPHGSHLGPEIACTVCHRGHQESKAYCVNCHTNFDMPTP